MSRDLGFRRTVIAIGQQSSSASYHMKVFVRTAREVLCAQSDLFQATAATVLTIVWSPLMLVIPDGVGYFSS